MHTFFIHGLVALIVGSAKTIAARSHTHDSQRRKKRNKNHSHKAPLSAFSPPHLIQLALHLMMQSEH